MASTYSTNLKIELIGTGEQAGTWGTTTNSNLGTALEQAIVGKADVTMSSTTITLTLSNSNAAQDARAIYLNLTGSPGGAAVLEVPAVQKPYIVKNGSDQQVTIKVSGQTGVPIPTLKTALVYNNGTDVVTAVDHIPSLTLGAALPVASGGTGITSFGTGVATFLGTPSSANLAAAVTDETGTGALVFATSPTFVTPVLGTPTSGALTNCTADGTNAVGFKNIPQSGSAKTTAYILATGDVGKFIEVGASGSITIPDATFSAGDVISIFNNTTGDVTITCTITTAYIAGADADEATVTLATRGICTILFISGTVCVISGNVS
jgi:hypothetical protein